MRILAVDQARNGGWSVFDYDRKQLAGYGSFSFDEKNYSFEKAIAAIAGTIYDLAIQHSADAVFFEDIQMQKSALAFKRLAQLQGALILMCEQHELLYSFVSPSQWQNYCRARGRSAKERKADVMTAASAGKQTSKILSLEFVKETFCIDTSNDNLADAVCIGWYCVNNVLIQRCRHNTTRIEGEQ